jgi:hypothetical protein
MKELATALVKAQAEMEAATKDSANPFFKSKYADLNAVMGAIKPAIAKYGLAFTQNCHDAPDAAKVETIIWHESGEHVSCGVISVPVAKHDAQGYGSALTYARRYSLSAAFGVGAEDDDGNAAAKAAPKKEAKGVISAPLESWNSLTQEQQSRLLDLANVMQEACDVQDYAAAYELLDRAGLEVEERTGLQTRFDSKTRTAMAKWRKENPAQQS